MFILVIATLVQLVEFFLKKTRPGLYASMGIYLPLITTNCAILAVTFDNITKGYNLIEAVVYAVGVAAGFLLSHGPAGRASGTGIKTAPSPSSCRERRCSSPRPACWPSPSWASPA